MEQKTGTDDRESLLRGGTRDTIIMVVDDAAIVRQLVVRQLKRIYPRACFVEAASLEEAKRKILDSRPRVLILDLRLPDGSGLELCRLMQGNAWFYETRVLIIAGYSTPGIRERSFRLGVSEFMPKPFNADDLADSMRRLMA